MATAAAAAVLTGKCGVRTEHLGENHRSADKKTNGVETVETNGVETVVFPGGDGGLPRRRRWQRARSDQRAETRLRSARACAAHRLREGSYNAPWRMARAEQGRGCSNRTRRWPSLRHARTAAGCSVWSGREFPRMSLAGERISGDATAPRDPIQSDTQRRVDPETARLGPAKDDPTRH